MGDVLVKQIQKADNLIRDGAVTYSGYKDGYYVFHVQGEDLWRVRIKNNEIFDCTCPDWAYRGHIRPCKHALAGLRMYNMMFKRGFKFRDDTHDKS